MDFETLVGLITTQAGAVIAVLGVVIGASITAFVDFLLAGRQSRFRVREKIVDKRIVSYEAILKIVKDLRETTFPPPPAERQIENRIPKVLETLPGIDSWRRKLSNIMGTHLHWLDRDMRAELMFLQNYLLNLAQLLDRNPGRHADLAKLARNDFIDFGSRLENMALSFFDKGALRFRLAKLPRKIGVDPEETVERLQQTAVFAEVSAGSPVVT